MGGSGEEGASGGRGESLQLAIGIERLPVPRLEGKREVWSAHAAQPSSVSPRRHPGKEEFVATFKGNEFFCYDLSHNPIQSSTDEITLAFRTLQRNGLMLHTGKSADYVNLSLKSGAVWLVINLGSGAFEALVEPVNGKFNDNAWHDVRVTRNLRQVGGAGRRPGASGVWGRMGVGSEATGMWGQASGRVAGCGSEGCLGFGWAGRGQECGRSGQAARTRIHTREEAAELSRARHRGKRKGRARIDAGDLVLKFQGLGLKNQVNWQQGDSGHGGMRQNLNDGPWGCSGMGRCWPDPGGAGVQLGQKV